MATTRQIKIFKPGMFTALDGTQVTFTRADLARVAEAYDPAADPAPLVVGHPKIDAPAWGWVKSLSFHDCPEGDYLVAEPEHVEPAFAEAVRNRRYPKISASFYPPNHPANPKPGAFYLKHVGFLGAAAPSVKGLGLVHFAEEEERELVTIETQTPENIMIDPINEPVDFAERREELERRMAEADRRIADADERERTANATVRSALHAGNVSFAETLVAAGRLAPAGRDLFVGVMDELEATATVSFGEAHGELAPVAAFRKLFDGSAPLINFGEVAAPVEEDKDQGGATSFAAPPGFEADPEGLKTLNRAKALQAEDPSLSFLDAIKRASG